MNVSTLALWQPILLSAVLAWVASALIHMLLKYHNSDYQQLSNEDEVATALRNGSPAQGFYSMPHCPDMKAMGTEKMQKRFADGPIAFVAIFPNGMPQMGKLVGQQFTFFVLGAAAIAYCAGLALEPGAAYMTVFRFVGTVSFLAFFWAQIPMSIWYGHPWSTTAKYLLDAFIYASLVAGSFAWLWPAAV